MSEALEKARKLLHQFEFQRERWMDRLTMLSGGERHRLQLFSILTKNPNFLILDEPSNDLDLNTLAALEGYLADFTGVLVIVSHDKCFTDKAMDHLFVFEGKNGVVKDHPGSLCEYAEYLLEQENPHFSNTNNGDSMDVDGSKKSNYKEDKAARNERRNTLQRLQKEMANLENVIKKLKPNATKLQEEINSSGDEGWTVLAELTEKLDAINTEVNEKEMQWLELAEEVEEELQVELADA